MSETEQIVARDVFSGKVQRVIVCGSRIESVEYEQPSTGQCATAPDEVPWMAPGLFDLQINGYGGHDFTSVNVTPDDVWAVAEHMLALGVTRFLPTVTTAGHEVLVRSLRTIAQAVNEFPLLRKCIPGIHLEGPFISAEDGPRGAHPRQHVRTPNWDEFCQLQEAATGLIRMVTLSPEYPEALGFIERATAAGVVVAIGHTAASPQQIRDAVKAGARLSTHLGNGCHLTLPRHPNYLWTQLADDRLYASFIFDGYHLPPDFMTVAIRAKGVQRTVLVSDLTGLAGLSPGRYSTALGEVELLPEGRLVVAGQRQLLAGAAQPLLAGVANAIDVVGMPPADAFATVTRNPSRVLGLPAGEPEPGQTINFILFRMREMEASESSAAQQLREVLVEQTGREEKKGLAKGRIELLKVYFRGERFPR